MTSDATGAADWERLRLDLLAASHPSGELFRRVATRCIPAGRQDSLPERLASAIDNSAYVEAAHALLAMLHPADGYMLGRLPTGSAHVRLMVEDGSRVRPVDSFREDGQLALAVLDVVLAARKAQYTQ